MSAIGTLGVAKKKSDPTPQKWQSKPIILQMRGTPEFKEWLEHLAAHDRVSLADLAERAIVRYAKHVEFTEPPPDR